MKLDPIIKTEYIEIPIEIGDHSEIIFPLIENLINAHITGIEIATDNDLSFGINGNRVLSLNALAQSWTTLELYDGKPFTNNFPTQRFFVDNWGATFLSNWNEKGLAGQKINFPNSFILFNPPFNVNQLTVLPVTIYYQDSKKSEQKDKKYEFAQKSKGKRSLIKNITNAGR